MSHGWRHGHQPIFDDGAPHVGGAMAARAMVVSSRGVIFFWIFDGFVFVFVMCNWCFVWFFLVINVCLCVCLQQVEEEDAHFIF